MKKRHLLLCTLLFAHQCLAAKVSWSIDGKAVAPQAGEIVKVPSDAVALSPAPAVPYELRFEALVPKAGKGVPDFGIPQIWFSVDYRGEQDQLAFALRGGRLQDAMGYDFRQRGWVGMLTDQMFAPENTAFGFRFHRLPDRASAPVSEGKWVSVSARVTADQTELWVNGKYVMKAERQHGEKNSVALGGSWQSNTFRNIEVQPLPKIAAAMSKSFQPRTSYPEAVLKIDFGPDSVSAQSGWTRVGESNGILQWDQAPETRKRQALPDERLSTLAVWAHGNKRSAASIPLPKGEYIVSIGAGDAGFKSDLRCIAPDGQKYVANTNPGEFNELRIAVSHSGGPLKLEFEAVQQAGALSYLVVEPAKNFCHGLSSPLQDDGEAGAEQRRQESRANYVATKLPEAPAAGFAETSLDGDWLFMPESGVDAKVAPAPDQADANWHVLAVPGFWNPIGWWCWGQSPRQISRAYFYEELTRCEQFTFDWQKTSAGWYRKHLMVPASYAGKRVSLELGGVATLCDVYVNGIHAGGNMGMFRPFSVDLTPHLRPGEKNLVAVWVGNGEAKKAIPGGKSEIAVTMVISREMVTELPRGIYSNPQGEDGKPGRRQGGIWQPVRLRVNGDARLGEVWPQTSGKNLKLRVGAEVPESAAAATRLQVQLTDASGKKVLKRNLAWAEVAAAGELQFPDLPVALWSPEAPNLYSLELELLQKEKSLDKRSMKIGFRDFAVRDGKFVLNGTPWRFFGANMPPHGLRPNDKELASKFVGFMKEGKQRGVRCHGSPFPPDWLDETDRQGIAVSYEGEWPWVMIGDDIPEPSALKVWKEEWIALVKANRHRPSIVMWTLNNECYSLEDKNVERRQKKWEIWQEIVKATREADPTRPLVIWSGHTRANQVAKLEALTGPKDDGDIDDRHAYTGTYTPSMLFNPDAYWKERIKGYKTPGRPFINQEGGTAYTNTDVGHQELSYLQTWHGQSWTGRQAYPNASPAFYLSRTARITKEQMEITRRQNMEGWLAFCNGTWYNNADRADLIQPFAIHEAVRLALQPRLVALLRPPQRVFQASNVPLQLYGINDAEKSLGTAWNAEIVLETSDGTPLSVPSRVTLEEPPLGGGVREAKVTLTVNKLDLKGRKDAAWRVTAKDAAGRVISENRYEVGVFPAPAEPLPMVPVIAGEATLEQWKPRLEKAGIVAGRDSSVVGFGLALAPAKADWEEILKQAEAGKRVLVLDPKDIPDSGVFAGAKLINAGWNGEVADFTEAGRKLGLAAGLKIGDMAWWQGDGPELAVYKKALTFAQPYPESVQPLIDHAPPHGYGGKWKMDFLVVRFEVGKGKIIISTLDFTAADRDPAAGILLRNIVQAMHTQKD